MHLFKYISFYVALNLINNLTCQFFLKVGDGPLIEGLMIDKKNNN